MYIQFSTPRDWNALAGQGAASASPKYPAIEPTTIKRKASTSCVTVWAGRAGRAGEQLKGRKGQLDWSGGRKRRNWRRALSQEELARARENRVRDMCLTRIKGNAPSAIFQAFSTLALNLGWPHVALHVQK